ncbi:MAG: ExbD/TolR family protein [Kofleriaceae bacterium]
MLQECGKALIATPRDPKAAFLTCGALLGDGPCRTAWDAIATVPSIDGQRFPTMITELTTTCARQHCGSSPPAIRACTTDRTSWTGSELVVWAELETAILDRLFTDKILVPAAVIDKYRILPDPLTIEDGIALNQALQHRTDANELVDGTTVVHSIAANYVTTALFADADKLVTQTSLDERPIGPPRATRDSGVEACTAASVLIDREGAWIGGPGTECFVPRIPNSSSFDQRLETQLRNVRNDCTAIEVAAIDGVRYQELIATMDLAIKVGLKDVALSDPAALTTKPPKAQRRKKAPATCAPTTAAPEKVAETPRIAAAQRDVIRAAPSIVITRDQITLGDEVMIALKDALSAQGLIKPLATALQAQKDPSGVVILQADKDTPVVVINRVVETAKSVGCDNLLFAVKNKN